MKTRGLLALCLFATACGAAENGAARPAPSAAPSGVAAADSGADAGADECGRQQFDVRRKPADVLLVLDRSGSMKQRIKQDPGGKDGWRYVDAKQTAIELFGPACESVKSSGADSVNVVFGCKSDTLF